MIISIIFLIIYIQNSQKRWALWTGFILMSVFGLISLICFIISIFELNKKIKINK